MTMCDQATQDKIVNVIQELTNNGEMFTAFDVTSILRSRSEKIRHREVREIVSKQFQSMNLPIDYTVSLIDVPAQNGNVQARLFHPTSSDISAYDPKRHTTVNTDPFVSKPVAKPVPITAKPLSFADVAKNLTKPKAPKTSITPIGKTTDNRGRLLIPAAMVTQAGFGAASAVNVSLSKVWNLLTIKTVNWNSNDVHYIVDYSGNLRIGPKFLRKITTDVRSRGFVITVIGNTIQIS
jgi:hypothetical protein